MNYLIAAHHDWNKKQFNTLKSKGFSELFLISKKNELNLGFLDKIKPKYIFFPHWSYKVPDEVLDNYTCICFHMTDLPYGRGGSPLQNLIVRGHKETKLSAIKMTQEFDAGSIYFKRRLSLSGKAETIYKRASKIAFSMIEQIILKEPEPYPQEGDIVSFQRRTENQSDIVDLKTLEDIYDHIRMLDAPSYPKAFIATDTYKIEFKNVRKREECLEAVVTFKLREK